MTRWVLVHSKCGAETVLSAGRAVQFALTARSVAKTLWCWACDMERPHVEFRLVASPGHSGSESKGGAQ